MSGNITGFLCSRQYPSKAILPCLDWAIEVAKDPNSCIMSTFHSPLEKEVLTFLLQGKCKLILLLGRSLYKILPTELQPALDANRLLIISVTNQSRITKESAQLCNKFILNHAHSLIFGFIANASHLEQIRQQAEEQKMPIKQLSVIDPIYINHP